MELFIAINHKNNRWLKNVFTAAALAVLFSCSHTSNKSSPTGISRLITESCPKKLDKEVSSHTLGLDGTVVVNIQVDKLGKATSVTIVQSSNNPQVDAAVISFYEQCDYTIAKINGRTVRGDTTQGYTYYL
jgi:TonB family protein